MRVFMMDLLATVPYYTAYLSQSLLSQGVDVQVGSITYYLDERCFAQRGLRIDPGLMDVVGRHPRLPRRVRRIAKLAESFLNMAALACRFLFRRPDVVHIQFLPLLRSVFPADLWFVRFCRWRGAKLVLTVHDLLPHDTAEQHTKLYAKLYKEMDGLICHSAAIEKRLIEEFGIDPGRIAIIPHGPFFFDTPPTDTNILPNLGVEPGQQMILWQGIIFPYKGVDLLLEAWKLVEQQNSNLCLVVLGNGAPQLTAQLEEQAIALSLQQVRFQFRFCSVEDLVAAYRAATAVVYPYRAITTSGALATGVALGKAIIASNLPVFKEVLVDGVNALIVNPADKDELANAICRLSSDASLRDSLEASVRSLEFGAEQWRGIAARTISLYERVLSSAN